MTANNTTPDLAQLAVRSIIPENATIGSQPINFRQAKESTQQTTSLVITHTKDWWSFLSEVILIGGSLAALGYMFSQLIKQSPDGDGQLGRKKVAEHVKAEIIKRIEASGRKIQMFGTSAYEDSLLDMIVLPNQIEVQFSDIGGLDHIKSDLMETVLVPLMHPDLTRSSRLCAPPLGVLFYGAPGTGKSMMAKAVARETNATFFNVDMSRLMSKWYGDSQKYISALFSLAKKMAPSIIWIDEIDALFSQRSRSDHQADVYNKALFLSLWDGLASSSITTCDDIMSLEMNQSGYYQQISSNKDGYKGNQGSQVIILGATNRPHEVDEAFLRRLGRQYEFEMPDKKTRKLILYILLQYEKYDKSVDLDKLAEATDEYSGSDLKELCKYAATLPLREYVRNKNFQDETTQQQTSIYDNDNSIGDSIGDTIGEESELIEDVNSKETSNSVFWKSLYTLTPGLVNLSSSGTSKIEQSGRKKRERAIDRYNDRLGNGKIVLRPINMKDFDNALKHIKSTLKAHRQHEHTFGGGTSSSFLDMWGTTGLANLNVSNPYIPVTKKQANDSSKNVRAPPKTGKDAQDDETIIVGLD